MNRFILSSLGEWSRRVSQGAGRARDDLSHIAAFAPREGGQALGIAKDYLGAAPLDEAAPLELGESARDELADGAQTRGELLTCQPQVHDAAVGGRVEVPCEALGDTSERQVFRQLREAPHASRHALEHGESHRGVAPAKA